MNIKDEILDLKRKIWDWSVTVSAFWWREVRKCDHLGDFYLDIGDPDDGYEYWFCFRCRTHVKSIGKGGEYND